MSRTLLSAIEESEVTPTSGVRPESEDTSMMQQPLWELHHSLLVLC